MNISKIAPNLHYCGKILKQGNKYFSGSFFKTLESGKVMCLNYKKGLLWEACTPSDSGEINSKIYQYDSNKRLIGVKLNGKDIFVKEIKNKLGLEFRRTESINGNIFKCYDQNDNLLYNRILSKALSSNFFRFYNNLLSSEVVKEDRYFISNIVPGQNGNYYLKVDKGAPVEPVFEWFKTIYRIPSLNHSFVLKKDGNIVSGVVKDSGGNSIGKLDTLLDKNNNPLWEQISNGKGLSMDFKTSYTPEGVKEREMCVVSLKNKKALSDKNFDEFGNVVKERSIERSETGECDYAYLYERKFNENNLMIEEKKYKESDEGKELICNIKKEYNSQNMPVKEEYYNLNNELESAEYNVYDKKGQLRVKAYKNYDNGVESGYDVYDKDGNLRKRAVSYEDEILEEYYDKNAFIKKSVFKDEKGIIKFKYEYSYDPVTCKKIKMVKRDKNNNILYTTDIIYSEKNGIAKETNIYKDAKGNLLGKQFIYVDDYDYKYIHMNASGKRCDSEALADILGEDYI